jgi:hypothetical protein
LRETALVQRLFELLTGLCVDHGNDD